MGKGLALRFAEKGWDVAVHYGKSENQTIDTVEEIRGKGVKAYPFQADVRNGDECEKAMNAAASELGVPDVLVNNAGVFPEAKEVAEISTDFWNDVINVNLRGEFHFARSFAKIAKEGARIINIASLGALEVWKGRLPYNVSKAGVVQLTKALALNLAPEISVNAVCPGAISMPDEITDADAFRVNTKKIPMGRYGTVSDIFDATYFFATASSYITGQIITVDGGYHLAR